MPFDFKALAEGLKRNNVGLAGITLTAEAVVGAESVTLAATGQKLPRHGAGPAGAAPTGEARRSSFAVVHAEDPARTALEVLD
jgi:hypothetical protein